MDSTKKYVDILLNGNPQVKETVHIALEDSVHVAVYDDLKMVKIVGGSLNEDLMGMYDTMKTRDYLHFFSTHPNSEVALLLLKSLSHIKNNPMLNQGMDFELFYEKLYRNV